MSYYANRKPEVAGSNSGGSGEHSSYQSVETSPSQSRSTSFESFQTAVLRNSRPVSNLPNSSSTAHDLTSMHHDPCIKVIQTSPSSVSLDKFAAHMAHSSSYSSLPPVPSSLAEFQSLPANIQHHQSSSSQCKTSASMSAALAAARPLVHNVQDLESSFTSIPAAVSGPTTVKSLIDNAVDEQMRQYQLQQQKIQSSASSAMSFIDEILSNIKPATEAKQPESGEERTPYKATSESATQQASVRSPDMLNKPTQSNLSAPNMPYAHHVNTLSPNGSTINDAVAIFNLANAASSGQSGELNKTPSKASSESVSVSSDCNSKVVKSLEMPSSVVPEPVDTIKTSESTELTKLTDGDESKKDAASSTMPTPASPSTKKEKDQNKSRSKTDKVKKDDKKEEKKDDKKEEKKDKSSSKKKENNVSVASSVKSESKKAEKSEKVEKKDKKESKKSNKENKQTKDSTNSGKKENVKESKSEEKKNHTVKTAETSSTSAEPSSVVAKDKDAAPKPQREKPAKKQSKSKSKVANTTTESQQQQQPSKSSKSTTESKDSDKRSAKKKTESSHEKQVVEESNKSDQLIQMLLAKLEKMNCKSSGHKQQQSALINRIKYQPDLLKRIRDERHEFIEAIWPDIFKAYSYCMDGRHWNPEHYFDIVQSGGDYEKIQNMHGKKSLNKPVSAPVYQQTQTNQYNHPAMSHHHQPSQYYKNNVNNMNNKRKFYDNNYHGGQYQSHQHQYQPSSHQNRQYNQHPYNNNHHHHQYVDNHSPEMPQVPRNSPKAYSEQHNTQQQQTKPQHLETLGLSHIRESARPEQHILNMLGLKREEEERVDSRLMNLLNRPAQTSHHMIENLLLAPKEPAKSKILTAHELEMMQLRDSQRSHAYGGHGDAMSDALRQLVKNLDNHPLSGMSSSKPSHIEPSSQLKQMLRIHSDESINKFPSMNPSEMPSFQQSENLLLASVNSRQAKEKEHFQSLVLNKLMPQPVDNIMKWFPQ